MIKLVNVSKSFQTTWGAPPLQVLDGINFEIAAGDSVAILGPSGSGKSTLLNIMGSLEKPTAGKVFFENRDLTALSDNELAEIRNQQVGFIFQLHHLLPQCTVVENVLMPALANPSNKISKDQKERAMHLLERVGLHERALQFPSLLSGGERQRVAVVRALINRPQMILADEPTGSLDQSSADNLVDLLLGLNREENVALVVVTHSRAIADRMNRVLRIADGKLVQD